LPYLYSLFFLRLICQEKSGVKIITILIPISWHFTINSYKIFRIGYIMQNFLDTIDKELNKKRINIIGYKNERVNSFK